MIKLEEALWYRFRDAVQISWLSESQGSRCGLEEVEWSLSFLIYLREANPACPERLSLS